MFGSLISGAIGLLGGKLKSSSAKSAARDANQFTKEQLQNRHQWEVDDLKKAGLNPVLSAGAAPSIGSSAQAEPINPLEDVVQNASTAKMMKRMDAEIDRIKADEKLTRSLDKKAVMDTRKSRMEADESMSRYQNNMVQNKLMKLNVPAAKNMADFETSIGEGGKWWHFLLNSARSLGAGRR